MKSRSPSPRAAGIYRCGNFGCLINLQDDRVGPVADYGPFVLERMCGACQPVVQRLAKRPVLFTPCIPLVLPQPACAAASAGAL